MLEIFQNTLFKWIFRQGSDFNRKSVTLDSGEPGFATDTKRLWVGDGVTSGGVLVGNLFKGSNSNITSFAPAERGDLAYNTDTRKLFRLVSNDGSNISDWEHIGGVYVPLNNTINISNSNQISVNTNSLSSFTITPLYARYNGGTSTITYQKNVTSVTKIGVGHYSFNFGPLPTAQLIPQIQIFGTSNPSYQARVSSLTNNSCQVRIVNLSGGLIDADIFFSIIR
jgi:hypothetical protein